MPAPTQAQTPVYKETANVKRFNTNWAQHDPRKQAGSALAKALGAGKNVIHDQATMQKKIDLEEGKRLALMGVARENLAEAAGNGGMFSGTGGWTMQGFDMQRGIEDAFIRQEQLVQAFNGSGLSATDDPAAFQAFVDAQREAIFAELEGSPDFYREGFMEGIAPAFQKMGRSWASSADTFRTNKRRAAVSARVGASIALGDQKGALDIINNAPADHATPHGEAKQLAADKLVEGLNNGSVENVDPEVYKQLNNSQKAAVDRALSERQELEDNQAALDELDRRKDVRLLKERAAGGDQEAWEELRKKHPKEFETFTKSRIQSETEPKHTETQTRRVDQLVKGSEQWGSQDMAETLLQLFEAGQLSQDHYVRLTQENSRSTVSRSVWKENSTHNQIVLQKYYNVTPDKRGLFNDIMDESISTFIATNNRAPTSSELSIIADEATFTANGGQ